MEIETGRSSLNTAASCNAFKYISSEEEGVIQVQTKVLKAQWIQQNLFSTDATVNLWTKWN